MVAGISLNSEVYNFSIFDKPINDIKFSCECVGQAVYKLWDFIFNINNIAKAIFFVIGAVLCYSLPIVAYLGATTGLILAPHVRVIVDRVENVLSFKRSRFINYPFYASIFVFSFITMPVSITVMTLYYSAKWSMILVEKTNPNQKV